MRSFLYLLSCLALCLSVLVSCASVNKQIEARAALKHAQFSLESVAIESIELGGTILKPSIKQITLALAMKVTNQSDHDMVLDSFNVAASLDKAQVAKIHHKSKLKIAAKKDGVTRFLVQPQKLNLATLFDTQNVNIKGEAQVAVSLIDGVLSIPLSVPIDSSIKTADLINKIKQQMRHSLSLPF